MKRNPKLSDTYFMVRARAIGYRYVNGVASSYDEEYPLELEEIIPKEDYLKTIRKLNNVIISFWPCSPCFIFG